MGSCGIYLRTIWLEVLRTSICKMSLKITLLKLLPHLPGASELKTLSTTRIEWIESLVALSYVFSEASLSASQDMKDESPAGTYADPCGGNWWYSWLRDKLVMVCGVKMKEYVLQNLVIWMPVTESVEIDVSFFARISLRMNIWTKVTILAM